MESVTNVMIVMVVTPWNSLPESTVNAPSSASFKKMITKCDLNKFLKINWTGV